MAVRAGPVRGDERVGTELAGPGRPDLAGADRDAELWERHAAWWQDGFTNGADPEYEEQILPLAAAHLRRLPAGARRRLRRGPDLAARTA